MPIHTSEETSIGVTAFKSQCLGLIDDVATGKTKRLMLMKHNRRVAAIVPIEDEEENLDTPDDLWGAMEGTVTVAAGVDLTDPIDADWKAAQEMAATVVIRVATPVLLDTRTAIWLMGKAPISDHSRAAIRSAQVTRSGVSISAFCAWEIGMLVGNGRLRLTKPPEDWFNELLSKQGVRLSGITPRILLNSTALPGNPPNDPADCLVIATAREHGF